MSGTDQRPLGDALVRMGLLTSGQLEAMLDVQRHEGRRLSRQLVDEGFLTEERLVQVLGEQLGIETIDLTEIRVHERVRDLVLGSVARQMTVLPIARRRMGSNEGLVLAMADPLDDEAVAVVGRRLPPDMRVVRLLAAEDDLRRAIANVYGDDEDSDENVPADAGTAAEGRLPSFPPLRGVSDTDEAVVAREDSFNGARTAASASTGEAVALGDPPTIPTRGQVQTLPLEDFGVTEADVPVVRPQTPSPIQPEEPATDLVGVDALISGRSFGRAVVTPIPSRRPATASAERQRERPTERFSAADDAVSDDPPPVVTPVVGPPTPSGGTRAPGMAVRRWAPATEIVRTRKQQEPVEPRRAPRRDITVRVAPPMTPSSALSHAVVSEEPSAADLHGAPEVLVKAAPRRIPPALLAMTAGSLVLATGLAAWVLSRPPTVKATLPATEIRPAELVDDAELTAALDEPAAPDPPLAPLRALGPIEIAPGILDGPPPPSHRFVLADGLELRATASDSAEPLLWLKAGQVVRVLHRIDDVQLVMVPPSGPAGFVSAELLGDRLPLSALARQFKFESCLIKPGQRVDTCLYDARVQWEDCRAPCRPKTRCEAACQMAFDTCLTSCRASEQTARR